MKKIYRILFLLVALIGYSSCNYLDIVPDETTTDEDTYADKDAVRDYLYSCYAYLPQCNISSGSLDQMTGDEVITAFEHETFAGFPKGNYSAATPVISYWDTFFQGIRQCYMLLERIDKVADLRNDLKVDYKAQTKFLIAYYHYLMARCYGPTLLIKETPSITTPVEEYLGRTPYDECVEWICNLFDEAANDLPAVRSTASEFGLATSIAAKSLKAKMRLYAASPLFNGNSKFYSNFVDKDGVQLMPLTYDANKWVLARDACKEAIELAVLNGHDLYKKKDYRLDESEANPYPEEGAVRCLRTGMVDWESRNVEVLFAETRNEGSYGVQNKSLPFVKDGWAWNGVCPTWAMLNRFYTKNGLPWDEDPEFASKVKTEVVSVDAAHATQAAQGQKTILFNLDREPRYYAWIAFQGGYFEVLNNATNPAYSDGYVDGGRLVCSFLLGGNCSIGTANVQRDGNYSPGGYLNKKGVDPNTTVGTSSTTLNQYPWPVIRLADLYLAYAEACIEIGTSDDLTNAKTYINYIRERAGIPTLETSWNGIATLNQSKLREIVRQERMIELYLENQNFWDMRRWLLAEEYFGVKAKGMNIKASTIDDFAKLTEISFERKFKSPTQYLLPIPYTDINRDPQLVNNPGY